MKKFITFIAAMCIALPAMAAPPKKEDKKKPDAKKEAPTLMWTVVVEGAKAETAGEQVKAFLSAMKDVKVESCEKKGETVEAVISSKMRQSRSEVSKALKDNKDLKVKDFKPKKEEKADAKKTEEPKKTEDPKKPADPKKPGDPK